MRGGVMSLVGQMYGRMPPKLRRQMKRCLTVIAGL
jgi:hypothetical protein